MIRAHARAREHIKTRCSRVYNKKMTATLLGKDKKRLTQCKSFLCEIRKNLIISYFLIFIKIKSFN